MIVNKYESDCAIVRLGLNKMLEGIFTSKSSQEDLIKFLDRNKHDHYNIRDKSDPSGKFQYKLTRDEVIENSKDYKKKFSVYESLAEADKTLILQGEIQIDKDFVMMASLSDVKGISNRIAMQEPKYNIHGFDLTDKREPSIRGLSKVLDYIISKELLDVVVEFSLFEIPVGINNEDIIIWELRNY